jgi:putative peptidoglycan lipid II flippase
VALPASAALLALGEPIVVALFQRGAFDAAAAHETARALFWQGGAIWTVAAVRQIVPPFYALGDTRTPAIVSAIDLVAFIALATSLKGPMGHVGISVAVAGSSAVQMLLLLAALRWRMGTVEGGTLVRSAARTLVASVAAAVAGWGTARILTPEGPAGGLARAVPGLLGLGAFVAVFAAVAWGMRSPELEEIASTLRRRLGRGRSRGET